MKRTRILPGPWWILLVTVLIGGCGGNYSGMPETETSTDATAVLCDTPTAVTPVTSVISGPGQSLYAEQCESCHGSQGEGTASGPSLKGCTSCSDADTLTNRIATTMPTADVSQCDVDCAKAVADYILGSFSSQNTAQAAACVATNFTLADEQETLYKASLNLTGELPPASVGSARAVASADLDQALDEILNRPGFYERLMEIYNDLLHQDKYLPWEDALNLLDSNDWPTRKWYNDAVSSEGFEGDEKTWRDNLRNWLRKQTNEAVAREALQLIAHVVRENRPFTEILTADYTLVNAYSARAYGLNVSGFRRLETPPFEGYENLPPELQALAQYDPTDFREVRLTIAGGDYAGTPIPHAGILTSAMFLNRFPTTRTNLNRHRARMVFQFFLDTDILQIPGARPDQAVDTESSSPTLTNPSCISCHKIMDPVASTFQNWDEGGRYRKRRLSHDGWPSDMYYRGLNGKLMPLEQYIDSSLVWLGKELVKDARFARATVKTLFTGLTGQEVLLPPGDDVPAEDPKRVAYEAQRAHLAEVERALIESGWNLKAAVKAIIKGPFYRAKAVVGNAEKFALVGGAQLLTPEMLDRKITAVTGYPWKDSWASQTKLDKLNRGGYNALYGGMNSDETTTRLRHPNGLMAAVQKRMASEVACNVLAKDFHKPVAQRLLFPHVETTTVLYDENGNYLPENEALIRKNLAHLMWQLWGQKPEESAQDIDDAFSLYRSVVDTGRAAIEAEPRNWGLKYLHGACRLTRDPETGEALADEDKIERDDDFALRGWQAVLNYMLADYRFLYE